MTTTLTFRNAVSAFVRRRNRWENAVLIPIQVEVEANSAVDTNAEESWPKFLPKGLRPILKSLQQSRQKSPSTPRFLPQ